MDVQSVEVENVNATFVRMCKYSGDTEKESVNGTN